MKTSRRNLIRGLAALPFALPALEILREPSAAQTDASPKRVVILSSFCGYVCEYLLPQDAHVDGGPLGMPMEKRFGVGAGMLDLNRCMDKRGLRPLAPYQDELMVVTGLDFAGTWEHHLSPVFAGDGGEDASLDTIDQHLGDLIGGGTAFPTLTMGVRCNTGEKAGRSSSLSRRGGRWLSPIEDAAVLFDSLFGGFVPEMDGVEPPPPDPRVENRRRVLDFVHRRLETVQPQLGRADQQRIEWHLDSISDLERRLGAATTPFMVGDGCAVPPEPASGLGPVETSELMLQLTTMALACDRTRVASLAFGYNASSMLYDWISDVWPGQSSASPITQPQHDANHNAGVGQWEDLDRAHRNSAIDAWHAGQMAELIAQLKAVVEPDGGTLFDNTTVIWANENRDASHRLYDLNFVVAGHGAGFDMGKLVRLSNVPIDDWPDRALARIAAGDGPPGADQRTLDGIRYHGANWDIYQGREGNDFWLTLLRAHGSSAATFGLTSWDTGRSNSDETGSGTRTFCTGNSIDELF